MNQILKVGEDVFEKVKLIQLGRRAILVLASKFKISKIMSTIIPTIYKQFKDLEGEFNG